MSTVTLGTAQKAKRSLDTIHHYLRLAARNEPFDTGPCYEELAEAIETLGDCIEGICDDCLKIPESR